MAETSGDRPAKRSRVDATGRVSDGGATTKEPAMTFPYALDIFQSTSIEALEAGDSVLVSAHTSAGKTTVALYAIAKALKERRRVIYTSPIKALSNQKFQEFTEKFDSVGLMTGDTTIKSEADCLVMTTEILRSMLYRGTEMLREVGCVIFDEVHYMRDKSRGVVWEETIIMLPEGCQYVFLSATIPNGQEFASWVEHIHPRTKCQVVYTDMRPVPLQHYLYPVGAEGIFLIVDEGKFRDDNFKKAMLAVGGADKPKDDDEGRSSGIKTNRNRSKRDKKPIMQIVKLVMDHQMYPLIVFAFSKAECERSALAMSQHNFNNDEESALVAEVFNNAMESLSEEDRKLPCIEHLFPMLQSGVGIHHSGLLPILKEVVELLFQAGLVKVLFATETFSMGLNMPARTVVFTAVKKFDGEKQRYLSGGEYIQMSGRAGRRGLDRVGIVIAMIDESVEPDTLHSLTMGGADVLDSSFHLTYNMVLNLLRVEDVDPEFMMKRSFRQFQQERNRPQLQEQVAVLEEAIQNIRIENIEVFREFTSCTTQLQKLRHEERILRTLPKYINGAMVPGRIIKIVRHTDNADFDYGVLVRTEPLAGANDIDSNNWLAHVLVPCTRISRELHASETPTPLHITNFTADEGEVVLIPFTYASVADVTRFRVKLPEAVTSELGKNQVRDMLLKLHDQYKGKVPPMTSEELRITDTKLFERIKRLERTISQNELVVSPTHDLKAEYELFLKRQEYESRLAAVREELTLMSQVVLTEDLKKMLRVLRRLDYIDKDNLILRKGRIACEITTSDECELLLTELLFKGIFNDMETEMIVALLSCLVNVHKAEGFVLAEEFQEPFKTLQEVVSRIASVSSESGIATKSGENRGGITDLMPSLMEVTYKWAKGAKFAEIVGQTTAYEGDIVRMMRRLEELLRQLAGAAKSPAIGSDELCDKFTNGIALLKRDIVFASSLYL